MYAYDVCNLYISLRIEKERGKQQERRAHERAQRRARVTQYIHTYECMHMYVYMPIHSYGTSIPLFECAFKPSNRPIYVSKVDRTSLESSRNNTRPPTPPYLLPAVAVGVTECGFARASALPPRLSTMTLARQSRLALCECFF